KTDFTTVAVLRRGFPYGEIYQTRHFAPVLLHPGGTVWDTQQTYGIGCSGSHNGIPFATIEFKTARWVFLERVYAAALVAAETHYPDLYRVRWEPCLPNWRELVLPDHH